MAGYTVAKIDDIEAIYGGGFKRARSALGITSFGLQVMDLPPNFEGYPEHDHSSGRPGGGLRHAARRAARSRSTASAIRSTPGTS